MLKFSEIFEISSEDSYFERIRMVRMVRMVRSLADRTFQLWSRLPASMVEARATETKEAEATETTAEDAASKVAPMEAN